MNTHVEPQRGGRGARQRILDAAVRLFYADGINATGVERLAAEASVSKRTLYQHFPSKEAVVEEYLRHIRQAIGDPIRPTADEASAPKSRILALFDAPAPGARCGVAPSTTRPSKPPAGCRRFTRSSRRTSGSTSTAWATWRQAGAANPKLWQPTRHPLRGRGRDVHVAQRPRAMGRPGRPLRHFSTTPFDGAQRVSPARGGSA